MKAPGSTFAKIRLCTQSLNGFYKYQKSQVGPTTKIKRQLVQRDSSQRKRSCISFCLAQRQGTSPAAAATASQAQADDDELLHAAALSMAADNSAEAMIEKVSILHFAPFIVFFKQSDSPMNYDCSNLDQMVLIE